MSEILLIVLLVLVAGILVLEFALWRRPSPIPVDLSDIHSGIERLHQSVQQIERHEGRILPVAAGTGGPKPGFQT
jgi:hypothetical protein